MARAQALPGRGADRWPLGVDSETIVRIQPLELRARLVVEGFLSGLHRSPYHGFSVEFSEYRPYSPGDDLRYLDWKLLARSDRHYIKRFEDETNLRCQLVVDLSRSMAYGSATSGASGSGRSPKLRYAVTIAATLAHFLARQRDAVGLTTFERDVIDFVPPRHRPGHLQRLLVALDRAASGSATGLAPALERVAGLTRERGLVVLISDLLAPLDGLDRAFGQLRARGQEVIVFRVLDPAELSFPFEGASMFEDLESGRTLYVDPALVKAQYQRGFEEHARGLAELCHTHGVDLVPWPTDRALGDSLFEYLQARARRGRSVLRRPGGGSAR